MRNNWFDDYSILEQEIGGVRNKQGEITLAVSLLVEDTEILLEYAQLKRLLVDMEEYASNMVGWE